MEDCAAFAGEYKGSSRQRFLEPSSRHLLFLPALIALIASVRMSKDIVLFV
jgi:hypothetical protein